MEELVNVSITFLIPAKYSNVFDYTAIPYCNENMHLCEQICINNNGSYACACNPGYALSINGFYCPSKNNNSV